ETRMKYGRNSTTEKSGLCLNTAQRPQRYGCGTYGDGKRCLPSMTTMFRPFVGFCPMWVQSLLLPRVMRWVHELRPRRAGAGDLKDHRFVLGHQEVVDVGRLSPKAARRQGLQ